MGCPYGASRRAGRMSRSVRCATLRFRRAPSPDPRRHGFLDKTMRSPRTPERTCFVFRPRAPLDARQTLARYGRWGPDPASPYREGTLHRVAKIGGSLVPFRLTVDGPVARPRAP